MHCNFPYYNAARGTICRTPLNSLAKVTLKLFWQVLGRPHSIAAIRDTAPTGLWLKFGLGLVVGTEGATDPEIYQRLVGRAADSIDR